MRQEYKAPLPLSAPTRAPLSADALYQQTSPAVVKVLVHDAQKRPIGQGSGFLVNNRGMIVTNHHVIAKAHSAMVLFGDKSVLPMTRVAAFDKEADVAIITVNGPVRAQPLELAAGVLPLVGSKVFAIGYPLGLTSTLSDGLVSGHQQKNARITEILTNAAISPGSSGGPLLTVDGKVVGITTASFTKGQNLNIVVPSSYIAELLRRCE